jgi:hypothetical protein
MKMLYEILKTSKLGASFAPDMYTALWAQKLARDGEVKTLSGAPPLSFKANGQPLLDYLISGNTVQSGTPTPANPVDVVGVGTLDSGQYKIPISSAGQTTPVYLGEVETTRRIKKLVLTGEENIDYSTLSGNSRFTIDNAFQTADYRIGICSHYKYEFVNANNTVYHTSSNTARTIFIFDNNYTSAANFKSYLQQQYSAGTPVTVWYVLANEETAVVNEPLQKIGDYADTLSMEQAGVEIPTARGTNTLDVLTDVKPSEIYIKYKE